ncbi:hypothetical protein NBRC116596_21110 [Litorivita sp. NS0012-18]
MRMIAVRPKEGCRVLIGAEAPAVPVVVVVVPRLNVVAAAGRAPNATQSAEAVMARRRE